VNAVAVVESNNPKERVQNFAGIMRDGTRMSALCKANGGYRRAELAVDRLVRRGDKTEISKIIDVDDSVC
jgi:hypothetical protein